MSEMAPIGVFADVTLGKMLQPSKNKPDDVQQPYLRAANIHSSGQLNPEVELKNMWFSEYERSIYDLQADDVLVVEGGAVGTSAHLKEDLPGIGFQNALNRLRPYRNSDGRYLHYCLQSAVESGEIDAFCSAVSIPHFTAEKISRFRIPFHDLAAQRRIADYLDRETGQIDGMLDKLSSLDVQLRDRKSALSSSFFVQDFKQVKLKWLLEEVDDRAGERSSELPLLSVSIHHGVQLRDGSLTNQNPSDNLSHYKVAEPGHIVLNRMRAFQGGLGVSKWHGLVSPDYSVLQAGDELTSGWAEFMMRTPEFVSIMTQALRGIGGVDQGNVRTPRINVRDLLELAIPLPSLEEQRRIADHLDDVTSKIDAMLAKVAELKNLLTERRAALITDVVTGRKDVA